MNNRQRREARGKEGPCSTEGCQKQGMECLPCEAKYVCEDHRKELHWFGEHHYVCWNCHTFITEAMAFRQYMREQAHKERDNQQ